VDAVELDIPAVVTDAPVAAGALASVELIGLQILGRLGGQAELRVQVTLICRFR
jgi:hypothetical protein